MMVDGVVQGLGEAATLEKDKQIGVENTTNIKPFWENSCWRFDEAGDLSFSPTTLQAWGKVHDQAYRSEIEKALGVNLTRFQNIDDNPEFNTFMSSAYIQQKL